MTEIAFRLYTRNEHGELEDMRHEFNLSDFGGIAPVLGDLIVDPGVIGGMDRLRYDNRTVYRVKERYFLPGKGSPDIVWIVLVVEDRCGDREESSLFD